ncbi:hypothetical protein QQF64_000786 [Cirrhinus molitorella]|uniref:Mucin-5AC-like n=1 Tax=Cirrhinus molitorella TaxID=172907 RepID=A0ABR3NY63_9TELE
MTGLPTTTVPADTATAPSTTTATIPSSTATQTTTAFEVTTEGLSRTTVAFTSTSSTPTTFALSTTTTSSPTMDSETTTASTTTTGIITGLTNTVELPVPVTSFVQNTSTSALSTFPDQTSTNTTLAETLTSNTTPLNITKKADASTTLQSASTLQTETSDIPTTLSQNVTSAATVTAKLVFSSLSSLPTETAVLGAVNTLLISRQSQLSKSLKIVSVTYQKISETSYAVIFNINFNNISISDDPGQIFSTYSEIQDVVNTALNTLLNEPDRESLQPKSSNFTSTLNQIDGRMEYNFQDGDAIQPVSFLNELRPPTTTTVFPETTTGFSVITPNHISGSAVVISKLVFSSSSPVPSEALVLSAINTLRNSRESQLNESVKLVNVTYEKISETSYAVIFEINLSNISMPENPEQRNSSYTQVQDVVNKALNTLLNEPDRESLQPKSSNFTSTLNQIDGKMEYTFQDGDAIQPVSFLNELHSQTVVTTASALTTPANVLGKALINIRLVFVTLGPLPDPDKILEVANTLLGTRLSTKEDTTTTLSDDVRFVGVNYTKINETAYALNFGFEISNITISGKLELRNGTHLSVQNSINTLLGKILLSNSSAPLIKFQAADFTGNSTVIQANVQYVFSPNDFSQPSVFVQALQSAGVTTTTMTTTTTSTTAQILIRKAIIRIRLEFITLGPRPSESSVLDVVKSVVAANLTTALTTRELSVKDPVTLANVAYLAINDTAYALIFAYEISQVSLTEPIRNETYQEIQKRINHLVNQILKEPSGNLLIPADFREISDVIEANVTYVFSQRNSNAASGGLVNNLFTFFTTPFPTTLNTTISNNGTNAAWVVAIIVPVAIVIGLVPCWILLCCLLCGCCAAIRRRWHRRRSYNVQYTTRNSIF